MTRILIIGGVAGGATAAARLRRIDEKAEIVLFERGEHISYANCGLPYYIGGTISERANLIIQTPEGFKTKFNVDVRVNTEVVAIHNKDKKVEILCLKTGKKSFEEYDKLILSPGASPVKPPIPGVDDSRIFTMRNVTDTDKIHDFIKDQKPRRAIVVGAGFIGLEMAENLHDKGIDVTIVEMASQVMTVIDYDMACIVHQHIMQKGIELLLNDGVSEFKSYGSGLTVTTTSGKKIETDMVIMSIGVRPEIKLAKEAGLEIGKSGGIAVDDYMQTSDTHIYAVGDAVEVYNPIIDKKVLLPLAGPANKQARIVSNNIIYGNKEKFNGAIGTAVAKVFDLTVASSGGSQKTLDREKIPYDYTIVHSNSHAGYYPGAVRVSLKLLFDRNTGRILGVQGVGYDGVEKRIDVIAVYIQKKMTVMDLEEFEHAYAPPYSSAKDPSNIAGFVAHNMIKEDIKVINVDELSSNKEALLVDVRTQMEIEAAGTISGAINIPFEDMRERLGELPKNRKIILFCAVGARGYFVARTLYMNGFSEVYNLNGGYETYKNINTPQTNPGVHSLPKQANHLNVFQPGVDDNYREVIVNACGLACPGPIMKLKTEIGKLKDGERMTVSATDPGFYKDVESWCNVTENRLISRENEKGIITAVIQKSSGLKDDYMGETRVVSGSGEGRLADNKTIVVFSDDFDRAIASFVIANGALAMGKKVSLFFTFWGLNILKKRKKPKVKKTHIGKMFARMLPSSSKKLKLSKMNMFGMGPLMMRKIMKSQNVASLEEMIQSAMDAGVEIIACQMSMDVMGVKFEELLDGVNIGGVANYLERADYANMNLFI